VWLTNGEVDGEEREEHKTLMAAFLEASEEANATILEIRNADHLMPDVRLEFMRYIWQRLQGRKEGSHRRGRG
jgi:hypothetical protein